VDVFTDSLAQSGREVSSFITLRAMIVAFADLKVYLVCRKHTSWVEKVRD